MSELLRSPKPLPPLGKGDPPFTIARLEAYARDPSEANERFARELLARTGPLVLAIDPEADPPEGRIQFRLEQGKITSLPVKYLGPERIESAKGIETIKYDNS